MIDGYTEVTEVEFREFLANYGKKLEHDCKAFCEPAPHCYYDFEKGTAPIGTLERLQESMQAYCFYDEGMGQGPPHFYVRRAHQSNDVR